MAYRIYVILLHCLSLQMPGFVDGERKTFLTLKTSSLLLTMRREMLLCVKVQLPEHHLSATHHLLQTYNTPHLKGPLFSLMLQGCLQLGMLQETCNASTLHVLCPSFLKDIPIAKTRMNGLLLPNLDVHLSLQAPSKGCSKNPKKR